MTVKVKCADFQQSTRSRSFPEPVTSMDRLEEISLLLVRSLYPPAKGIRLVGVSLSNFKARAPSASDQLALA